MSSTSGLSRRRGVNTTAVDTTANASSNASPSTSEFPTSNGATHAGTALEGGQKIAFDPRDLIENEERGRREGGKAPRLTLLEEVLLLGLKDKAGYLSFWNDNISYALRGCILVELALRRRIAMVKDPSRRRYPLPDRLIEVIDDRQTGETILDEALKMINSTEEKMGVGSWIDLMSGETWNVLKIGFQLKQVRERLAKGLVDKGVLRTEKRNFLLFDMATHPISDTRAKDSIVNRVVSVLTARTTSLPKETLLEEGTQMRVVRSVALVCAAYAASVLENALTRLGYEEREDAFGRCDDILSEFCVWPFGSSSTGATAAATQARKRQGLGSSGGKESVYELVREAKKELQGGDEDLSIEIVATVFEVFSRMDSLL
ncbi:hypothetical protein M422DRAFT_66501 [Sphaerobolus stellatus SS14]|nr:hypothetical protein M422DRAFT_66501 [Sphaerobolus stellatus SS14]